jgi:hypothetical protein
MMQKAMQLKQKKNLDFLKGNSFTVLDVDYLNQCAAGVGVELGNNPDDANLIINKLIRGNII